jgi:hypothetical protein
VRERVAQLAGGQPVGGRQLPGQAHGGGVLIAAHAGAGDGGRARGTVIVLIAELLGLSID